MPVDSPVYRYHDGTKHHFAQYARSLGYLDWASQPRPFRTYEGALRVPLFPHPAAPVSGAAPESVSYRQLFDATRPAAPLTATLIGDLVRHAFGLSAWKVAGTSRWALRVNPSSGNLHPTEVYIACPRLPGLSDVPALFHYAPEAHAFEQRARLDEEEWRTVSETANVLLVVLTSIHWREAWKYGERAFRYCQHDLGHAIAAVALAARLHGWRAQLLPGWSSADMASVAGLDRDADFVDAEREEPACVLALLPESAPLPLLLQRGEHLARLAHAAHWSGHASQLSEHHIDWSFIDEIAKATRVVIGTAAHAPPAAVLERERDEPRAAASTVTADLDARTLLVQRRSAVAFDGRTAIERDTFASILRPLLPVARTPWNTLWWRPAIHLLLFVHRVTGLDPGLYFLARTPDAAACVRESLTREWSWEAVDGDLPLFLLGRGDCRGMARRLSCHQDIAADGCFSLGMLAEFDRRLALYGDAFYRQLFWESGVVGHLLYLEAEAAGIQGTGIGCFFDDAVHEIAGLTGHAFQSLYHFTVGGPVEDRRLTTEPGYDWETLQS